MSPSPDRPAHSALITGAAGTLGTALTRQFAAQGWTTFAGFHRSRPSTLDPGVVPLDLDVTRDTDWKSAAETIGTLAPSLAVLVHNAGVADDALLVHQSEDSWDRSLSVNLRPAVFGTRRLLPLLARSSPAHVVLVGSLASTWGGSGQSAYSTAKAALVGLAQSLARELAPHGIRVNTIFPGVLPGTITDRLTPKALEQLVGSNLLATPNDPVEVARFVTFLASTRNISGQVFNLDSRVRPWC